MLYDKKYIYNKVWVLNIIVCENLLLLWNNIINDCYWKCILLIWIVGRVMYLYLHKNDSWNEYENKNKIFYHSYSYDFGEYIVNAYE